MCLTHVNIPSEAGTGILVDSKVNVLSGKSGYSRWKEFTDMKMYTLYFTPQKYTSVVSISIFFSIYLLECCY